MAAASVATNTIFSAAYFQGFGVLIIPIERTFGWDRWVISGVGFIGLTFTNGIVTFFSASWSFSWEDPASAMWLPGR